MPSKTEVYGLNQQSSETELVSKTTYTYDEGDFTGEGQNISSVIQHDNTNYGASFTTGRGNLTTTERCNAELSSETDCVGGFPSKAKYNTAGAVVKQIAPDVAGNPTREVKISYADKFNDGDDSRNTYAYPTRITTAGAILGSEVFSHIKYRFDTGANVRAESPAPQGQTYGKITTRVFDDLYGRLQKESVWKDIQGTLQEYAYTRYQYFDNQMQSKVFTTVKSGAGEAESESWTDGAGRVRRSKTELPNSTNGWAGRLVEYDILGRVKRSTAPAEFVVDQTTGDWLAAGDDAQYGWLWTSAEYDWQGRVTREINSDGITDRTFAYDGCGCAGGQVTTVKGENIVETDWQGSTTTATLGRRTQKIYADIHSRTYKTEIYNFDGIGAPYATTVTKFNGRDQAVSVKQYAGAETSSSVQETSMTYDGFGRLETQHRPEQDANKNTIYSYNADGSIASVADARDATTSYEYEHRGLLKKVSYSVPTGSTIQIPATVNFAYDAPGNRTSMTETTNPTGGIAGLGGTTYAYDSLSRLTGEMRTINDPATGFNQSFTFNYEYNLAGQLTEFSDLGDLTRKVSYARDEIGRVTSVKNSQPNRFANVEDYATNIQYRAFGAIKSLTYGTVGTDKNLLQTFNNRLQLDEFSVSGGSTTDDDLASKNKYYADGRIKSAGSLTGNTYENKFDRLYKYDHLGRISEAKSGIEARDASATSTDRPYRQTYGYNSFGNLTNRTGKVWDREPAPMTVSYTNNRRGNSPHWVYDADGRNALNDDFHTFYDAAGRRYGTEGDLTITQTFDGGGQRIKQRETNLAGGNPKTRYYVNSSVLGTIYEIDFFSPTNWRKKVGLVYLNGQKLAVQSYVTGGAQSVSRLYENPITGSTRGSDPKLGSEPDALGVNAGTTAPPPEPPDYDTGASDLIIPRHADALDLAAGCTFSLSFDFKDYIKISKFRS